MIIFWVFVLASSILLYVLLDGFDLGIGILYGVTGDEARRRGMMSAVAPIWDGNETWLVFCGVASSRRFRWLLRSSYRLCIFRSW